MITAGLRRAILAAAGLPGADPLLRPGQGPGSYASSLPFRLARRDQDPRDLAAALAARLAREPWVAAAQVTGPGFLTVTVTHDALAGLAVRITRAGPACAESDALRGRTVPIPPPEPPTMPITGAPGWPQARAALAAQLTARLAAAAGATLVFDPERAWLPAPASLPPALPGRGPVADAAGYAGADAVRFALARMPPGGPASGSPVSRAPYQVALYQVALYQVALYQVALYQGALRRRRRSSRGTCWRIPLMLFGTRMPLLPPCCAGPPRWAPGQPGSRRACSPNQGSWRCSTRCPGSRNGWPWPRAADAPTSSPGTWRSWQCGRLAP